MSRFWRKVLLLLTLPGLVAGPGCTRRWFRERADKDVACVLSEKTDPRWDLEGFTIAPDPRARFFDISDPDKPPMPPDDPAAHATAPNPQKPGKAGVARIEGKGWLDLLQDWDAQNRAERQAREEAEKKEAGTRERPPAAASDSPSTAEALASARKEAGRELADPVTTEGPAKDHPGTGQHPYLINLEQSVELGLINSREYQTRREGVYLAALPVTLERFAFVPQVFATEQYFRERFGAGAPGGPLNRSRWNSNLGFSKLFSTGGLLLASFANQTVVNIGQPNTSVSTISLDFIQPLLRGAGRAVTLEPLTQAERNLLYVVRDFAKFRQEFYVFIAAGQPAFIPGVQAGVSAVSGGTVATPGPFVPGPVPLVSPLIQAASSTQVEPGNAGRLGVINPSGATPQGFLSAVGEKAVLVNQYRNIDALRRFLNLFQVYLEGGLVNAVQVGQVEQQLLQSLNTILTNQANYRISIDQFKQQLGLPMTVNLELTDDALRPMFDQTRRYEEVSSEYERLSGLAAGYARRGEERLIRPRLRKLLLDEPFVAGTAFPKRLRERWAEWEKVADAPKDARGRGPVEQRLDALSAERRKLQEKRDKLREGEKGDLPAAEAARLEAIDFDIELGRFERSLRLYENKFWEATKDEARAAALRASQFNTLYRLFLNLLEEPFRERREKVRQQWSALPPLCIDGVDLLSAPEEEAIAAVTRVALENRLDLMNQRAQLVDSWRKIRVAANSLMGVLDVQLHYDTNTPLGGSRPLAFGGNRNRAQVAVNAQMPLVRIAERNAYRAALIAYQQQRRQLQLAEDNVIFAVRLDLRQLRAAANNYHKVQKRNVELAYSQVDQSLQAFSQPQSPPGPASAPGAVGAPAASGGGGDPAALTQQLLSAQNSLLQAVNGLYNTWINYLTTRMALYRDLGVMPLDTKGNWIDDATRCCPVASEPALLRIPRRAPSDG
ncbi:MAG: TolC family protein [Gemmataceae bacterium]|nr:TolC family protein [Gemmataceae bacterium]